MLETKKSAFYATTSKLTNYSFDNAGQTRCPSPVNTRYCGDIGFPLDFHRDVDRLLIGTEVTSLYYYNIFFQNHNDIVAIT